LTSPPGSGLPEGIAADVHRIQAKAAGLPSPDKVRELADQAVQGGPRDGMSLDEIRHLAAAAVQQSEQVAELLRRLNTLLRPGGDGR
jgi:hypothetical protein